MRKINKIFRNEFGQSLVELLIVIGLASIILPTVIAAVMSSREGRAQERKRMEAVPLLREAQDAARSFRDNDWNTFAVDGTFHPQISSGTWILSPGAETINAFTRQIVIAGTQRDDNGNIVSSGGTNDPSTKKLTITVSWTNPRPSQIQSVIYLTRHTNLSKVWTTDTDFNTSGNVKTSTVVTNNFGGEVVLGSGGSGDWCTPTTSIVSTLDLPGQGIATAISAIPGHAYVTTGGNSSGNSMDSVNITSASPPVATNGNSYNNYKTYGIFATTNYIYLTSDHPGTTVDIVNESTFTSAGYFGASGGGTGQSVFISGNTGFVTAGNYLYAFDVSTIQGSSSQTQLGRVQLNGTGQKVIIVGNYAFIATNSTANQLQIVDVSNPASMSIVKSVSMGNGLAGVDLYISSQTYVYLVTTYATGKNDFYIIDVSNVNSPLVKGSYSTNGMNPKGVSAVPGNRVIIVGSGGEQYQAIIVSDNGATITRCGGLTNPNGATAVNAVAGVSGANGAFSYILTNDASHEFQIIEGGPGGTQYSPSGTYESNIFDVGTNDTSNFNSFSTTFATTSATKIEFQVAVAGTATSDCTTLTYDYVGWDGTATTKFLATTSAIPLGNIGTNYKNPGRCFRFKSFLSTTDNNQTPVLYDFTVNYSP